jgi:predicted transport protein
MFVKVKVTMEALKIYLKLHYSELESPPNWLRDYEKVSRQTWVEGTIRERDLINETILLDSIFDLIRKSFNRVIKHPKISKVSVEKPVKTLPDFVHPTKMKFDIEIGTDGFCNLGISVHKSQLIKVLEKLL